MRGWEKLNEVIRVGPLFNGAAAFIRRGRDTECALFLSFPYVRTQLEGSYLEARKKALTRT